MKDETAAWELVTAHTQGESLRNHMRAVAVAMRAYARRFGGDEALWGAVGLLHDFDYEENPDVGVDGHPLVGVKLLREQGWPEEVCRAILSHAESISGIVPETPMEKTLVAVDELSGLITAVALVRPSRDIRDVTVKSVRKKWKDKRFAAGVDRDEIEHAAARLGVPLDEHIGVVLEAMQAEAADAGAGWSVGSRRQAAVGSRKAGKAANAEHTTHNLQRTTHNAQRTTHGGRQRALPTSSYEFL